MLIRVGHNTIKLVRSQNFSQLILNVLKLNTHIHTHTHPTFAISLNFHISIGNTCNLFTFHDCFIISARQTEVQNIFHIFILK